MGAMLKLDVFILSNSFESFQMPDDFLSEIAAIEKAETETTESISKLVFLS